jgi:hypothetical protein
VSRQRATIGIPCNGRVRGSRRPGAVPCHRRRGPCSGLIQLKQFRQSVVCSFFSGIVAGRTKPAGDGAVREFGQHQPLNRQAKRYTRKARRSVYRPSPDQIGVGTAALIPLFKRLEAYVLSAERLHRGDTTVPSWPKVRPTLAGSGSTCAKPGRKGGRSGCRTTSMRRLGTSKS